MFDDIGHEDIYDMVESLKEESLSNVDTEDEFVFIPRGIRGVRDDYYFRMGEDALWFAPIPISREQFNNLTTQEIVRYIISQELTIQ